MFFVSTIELRGYYVPLSEEVWTELHYWYCSILEHSTLRTGPTRTLVEIVL